MTLYSFRETLNYFSDKLNARPPEEDLEAEEVELVVDKSSVIISKGKLEGSLKMEIAMGLMTKDMSEAHLKDLAASNFLGINTAGCTFALDETASVIKLKANLSSASSPQESWEWLHRILHVSNEWMKTLDQWEEFLPFNSEKNENKDAF